MGSLIDCCLDAVSDGEGDECSGDDSKEDSLWEFEEEAGGVGSFGGESLGSGGCSEDVFLECEDD